MTPNVYVEARPTGRPEGSAIKDYVVEGHRTTYSQPSKHRRRQSTGPERTAMPRLGARERHLNDKKKPGPLAGRRERHLLCGTGF